MYQWKYYGESKNAYVAYIDYGVGTECSTTRHGWPFAREGE